MILIKMYIKITENESKYWRVKYTAILMYFLFKLYLIENSYVSLKQKIIF